MACCLLNSVAWYGATSSSDCCSCRTVSVANLFLWSITSPVLSTNTPFGRRAFRPARPADARRVHAARGQSQDAYRLRGRRVAAAWRCVQSHMRMHARAPDRHTRSSPSPSRRPMPAATDRLPQPLLLDTRQHGDAAAAGAPAARSDGQIIDLATGRDAGRPRLRASRDAGSVQKTTRPPRELRPGAHTGPVAPNVTPARPANVSGSGSGWSMFAAHPWSLINDHLAAPGRFGDPFPRPFTGPRAARCSRAARHRTCACVLRMDERNVRGKQQEGGAASKPEASHSAASRREGGRPFGTHDRPRVTRDRRPPLRRRSAARSDRGGSRALKDRARFASGSHTRQAALGVQ
jgi:hypothetical protein